jgi:hypothetical protein
MTLKRGKGRKCYEYNFELLTAKMSKEHENKKILTLKG